MALTVTHFTPVEQTAFLTEYARALDSRWQRPILGDRLADEIVSKIDYDFAALGVSTSVVCQSSLRAKMIDDRVRSFTSEHPDAVVVDLGAGLDTGMQRVNPSATVDWYSVDLPDVIALRDEVVPAATHAHSVPASVADDAWTDTIPSDRPTMLLADGLLAFLSEEVIIGCSATSPTTSVPVSLPSTTTPASAGSAASQSGWRRRRCSAPSEANGVTGDSRMHSIRPRGTHS